MVLNKIDELVIGFENYHSLKYHSKVRRGFACLALLCIAIDDAWYNSVFDEYRKNPR